MGKNYQQLSLEERNKISSLQADKKSIRQIATIMDRSASTIAREIARNKSSNGIYKALHADEKSWARRWKGSRLVRQPELQEYVVNRLVMGWSPQQIAGRLRQEESSIYLSHESIYRFIYTQYAKTKDNSWRLLLPRAKFKRGFRGRKGGNPVNFIKHRVSIDQRPKHVAKRKQIGHWETDLIMFSNKKHNVLVTQERLSRFVTLAAQTDKKAQTIFDNHQQWFANMPPKMRKTLTQDNGTEFSFHHLIANKFNMKTYFCDPHSPWQKGGIENLNGRLRRYLPRHTDLTTLSEEDLQLISLRMNTTPRKCLDYKTPLEVFSKHLLHFKCELTKAACQE